MGLNLNHFQVFLPKISIAFAQASVQCTVHMLKLRLLFFKNILPTALHASTQNTVGGSESKVYSTFDYLVLCEAY